jgi:acetyl-CoA carboxylase biotin carboxylase subunit
MCNLLELMQVADVPVIPGQDGIVEDNFATVAEKIGFPLLVKAAAGGGGKGMRVVEDADDLEAAVAEGATHVRVGTAIFGPRSSHKQSESADLE